jgi:sugar phosphate isomerase/epimerase
MQNTRALSRRQFVQALTLGAAAGPTGLSSLAQESAPKKLGIKLGFDNFSVRGLGWKAGPLLDYAASLKVDTLLMSDLKVYESHDEAYLKDLRKKAADLGVEIQAGTYSICPTSRSVTKDYGTPEEHLALAIRIARTLGSSVVRCVLGSGEDRNVPGGIEKQIAETVKVLKSVRTRALDAGIKIGVENHAGDMQAWELVTLIEDAGKEFVGATMDCGNAAWTLEDPMVNLELLGPYAVATGIRDTAVWEIADGVQAHWTAMGEGNTDWKAFVSRYATLCPKTPFVLEIISEWGRPLTYLKPEFWKPYPKARANEFARFIAFAKRGKPCEPYKIPAGRNKQEFDKEFQKADLEKSLRYCKDVLGLGLTA